MARNLSLDRVGELLVTVTYSRVLGEHPHDVFCLDAGPASHTGRFDETPYLDLLEPLLREGGEAADSWTLQVVRTHRSRGTDLGQARIAADLATGRPTTADRATREEVQAVFRKLLDLAGGTDPARLRHEEALMQARLRVEEAYPEVYADRLAVTDEEHLAAEGMWSVGLVHGSPARTRFRVLLGFVDGDPGTTHIRRLPGSEVVDSVGTGGNG